ncbi:MAG: hypothetical protein LBC42_00835 [Puniceicoccales bacterium]|nr:hypothetical protein [Puniceicoccales bacterium]
MEYAGGVNTNDMLRKWEESNGASGGIVYGNVTTNVVTDVGQTLCAIACEIWRCILAVVFYVPQLCVAWWSMIRLRQLNNSLPSSAYGAGQSSRVQMVVKEMPSDMFLTAKIVEKGKKLSDLRCFPFRNKIHIPASIQQSSDPKIIALVAFTIADSQNRAINILISTLRIAAYVSFFTGVCLTFGLFYSLALYIPSVVCLVIGFCLPIGSLLISFVKDALTADRAMNYLLKHKALNYAQNGEEESPDIYRKNVKQAADALRWRLNVNVWKEFTLTAGTCFYFFKFKTAFFWLTQRAEDVHSLMALTVGKIGIRMPQPPNLVALL